MTDTPQELTREQVQWFADHGIDGALTRDLARQLLDSLDREPRLSADHATALQGIQTQGELVKRQDEDIARLREAFRRFITQAMTFRKVNTDEWVEWFEKEAIAEAKEALGRPGDAVASSGGSVPAGPLRAVPVPDAGSNQGGGDRT